MGFFLFWDTHVWAHNLSLVYSVMYYDIIVFFIWRLFFFILVVFVVVVTSIYCYIFIIDIIFSTNYCFFVLIILLLLLLLLLLPLLRWKWMPSYRTWRTWLVESAFTSQVSVINLNTSFSWCLPLNILSSSPVHPLSDRSLFQAGLASLGLFLREKYGVFILLR